LQGQRDIKQTMVRIVSYGLLYTWPSRVEQQKKKKKKKKTSDNCRYPPTRHQPIPSNKASTSHKLLHHRQSPPPHSPPANGSPTPVVCLPPRRATFPFHRCKILGGERGATSFDPHIFSLVNLRTGHKTNIHPPHSNLQQRVNRKPVCRMNTYYEEKGLEFCHHPEGTTDTLTHRERKKKKKKGLKQPLHFSIGSC
jgi:hypothetical protein